VPRTKSITRHISIGNINTSDVRYTTVDYRHLAMVASVPHKAATPDIDTRSKQPTTLMLGHASRAKAIDQQSHTQPLTRLATKQLGKHPTDAILRKYVILHVDALARTLDISNKTTKNGGWRDEQFLANTLTMLMFLHRKL
jgi:hypothetical protein